MKERKEMKKSAKQTVKKHYWFLVAICLIAIVLGAEYTTSLSAVQSHTSKHLQETEIYTSSSVPGKEGLADVITAIFSNDLEEGSIVSEELKSQFVEESNNEKMVFSRSEGLLAYFINSITSGSILVSLVSAMNSIINSSKLVIIILIFLGFSVVFLFWMCVRNVFKVIMRRLFLESRIYEKVSIHRIFFLRDLRKWWKVSVGMLWLFIFKYLWSLTIVGGIIKKYSYYWVPYILAENPDISGRKAINLSRRMMNGHKWECFVYELSFAGWWILGIITLGISKIFFSNAYQTSFFCEYYTEIRRKSKENKLTDIELLNDMYLFEKADKQKLIAAYAEIPELNEEQQISLGKLSGIRKFCAEVFGIALVEDDIEQAYQNQQAQLLLAERYSHVREGMSYPTQLSPIGHKKLNINTNSEHYIRHYSIYSIILLFFTFSFIGWVWEVSLHLVFDGTFVNRGALYGPWLPIYGGGGVLILALLNKFRKKALVEFGAIIVLCGLVEYFTSYYLEIVHNGMRWWDYTGYFFNFNGRICAEGLLVFGVGGMAIVYLLAPRLDNLFRSIKKKIIMLICLVLLAIFIVDFSYSMVHPNTGVGITDYSIRTEMD